MAKQGQGQVSSLKLFMLHFCLHIHQLYDYLYFYQVLVCAPSNVAVDQLAEKISATGLKVKKENISIKL